MVCLCYAVGRQQKHASDVCGAAEAKAGRHQGRHVGLVGVLRGRLIACMAHPCYAAGRLQTHADDVSGATEALQGGRHGRPVGLIGVLRGRLTTCMDHPCYAFGRLEKHARDICGATVRRRGNFSRSVYNGVWCGNGSAFGEWRVLELMLRLTLRATCTAHVRACIDRGLSGDVGGSLEKSYLFCLTACPPWNRLSLR